MNEQRNNGKGVFYGVIGVATLVVAIIGATFAATIIPLGLIFIKTVPYFNVMQELTDKINQVSREILMGIPVIKAFVKEFKENSYLCILQSSVSESELTNFSLSFRKLV